MIFRRTSRAGIVLVAAVLGAAVLAVVPRAGAFAQGVPASTPRSPTNNADPAGPPDAAPSSWIGTAEIGAKQRYGSAADGDLWPTCWASNDNLYAAWGDGKGFDLAGTFHDMGVAEIAGPANALTGKNLAVSDAVVPLWHSSGFTRKPTGMLCVGDTLYVAVQDLARTFDDAPSATIAASTDGGKTWTADRTRPMFDDHVFTTLWFADFGPGGAWNTSRYAYAYGLDGNWRDSYRNTVPDPTDLFLARVPKDRVTDRSAWEFFAGAKGSRPTWSRKVADRAPVLHDARRVYSEMYDQGKRANLTTLSQGHVLYDRPLGRYLYSSWSEYAHHLYESPTLWGPWKRMADRDYTSFNLEPDQYGGYGTILPSKFLSADGRSMLLQSNVCCSAPDDSPSYHYSLRTLDIAPLDTAAATNPVADTDLATARGTVAISKSARQPSLAALSDGATDAAVDDKDGEVKTASWWGYTWPYELRLDRVDYTTGEIAADGGWFVAPPRVQVRQGGAWVDVPGQATSPAFVPGAAAGPRQHYSVRFPSIQADGVRLIGSPGGDQRYTSMSELAVSNALQVVDGGFESTYDYGPVWGFDGTAGHGFDGGGNLAHTGKRNAWIRTQQTLGRQYLTQRVAVEPGSRLDLSAWLRTSASVAHVLLGARWDGGGQVASFDAGTPDVYARQATTFTVPPGVHEVTVLVGYSADGGDAILQADDVTLGPAGAGDSAGSAGGARTKAVGRTGRG